MECYESMAAHDHLVFYPQEAASILETIYSEYANAEQKAFLIQEFYGADFAFFKVQ